MFEKYFRVRNTLEKFEKMIELRVIVVDLLNFGLSIFQNISVQRLSPSMMPSLNLRAK